jgi:hypothetical protein
VNCPVCDAAADDITPSMFDGRRIRCTVCGVYEVAGPVDRPGVLKSMSKVDRRATLERARRRAAADGMPVIDADAL